MIAPPLFVATLASDAAAAAVGRDRARAWSRVAVTLPPPTWRRPTRRRNRCAATCARSRMPERRASIWQVGSNEPGLDLARGRRASWTPGRSDRRSSIPRGALRAPVRVHPAPRLPLGGRPGTVTAYDRARRSPAASNSRSPWSRENRASTLASCCRRESRRRAAAFPGSCDSAAGPPSTSRLRPKGSPFAPASAVRRRSSSADTRVAVTSARLPGGSRLATPPRLAAPGANGLDRLRHLGARPIRRRYVSPVAVTLFDVMGGFGACGCAVDSETPSPNVRTAKHGSNVEVHT